MHATRRVAIPDDRADVWSSSDDDHRDTSLIRGTGRTRPEGSRRCRSLDSELASDEVHVWRMALDLDPQSQRALMPLLSADEMRRCERFRFERERVRYLIGHAALRSILGQYLARHPADLRFSYERLGKPLLDGHALCFNRADSAGWALCAVTHNRRIGVDIEEIRDIPEMEDMIRQILSPRELTVLLSLDKRERREAFFQCWTGKEAFVKALGVGLTVPLTKFDVPVVSGEPNPLLRLERDPGAASEWSITKLSPAPGFAAALAVHGRYARLRRFTWSFETSGMLAVDVSDV